MRLPMMKTTCCKLAVLALVFSGTIRLAGQAASATRPAPTPEQLAMRASAEKDHQRLMNLLGIKELRPGSSYDSKSPELTNYDESKANVYPNLPDPLLLKNGKRITSAQQWWTKRRPEIVEDFDREILGRVPANLPKVSWEVVNTTREKVGNEGPTWQQQVLARGWGYAILTPTSFQADNGAGLTAGIIGLMNKGQPRKLDDWGTLRAWAWGASRALDYFETDKSVDAKQVGLEGHSRFGKTALVAMAYDPRF